ncbi:MAG: cytochrome c family protein [Desulfatirhabdiaceae bacterium]|nr:cytochrome c family protein [Desulfatirhabdiaceae bacterium]
MGAKNLKRLSGLLAAGAMSWLIGVNPYPALSNDVKTYVGSESCQSCHDRQYASYIANAAKAHSFEHVQIMKKGLTAAEYQGCLKCHTTAYGEPGGFISVEATPALKNPGCEVCHGPGSQHIESGDPKDIKQPTMAVCGKCHTSERVNSFKFKPVLFGGAH